MSAMLFKRLEYVLIVTVTLFLAGAGVAQTNNLFDPPAVYLTWQRDPSTTMTVHWHTTNRQTAPLQFKSADGTEWKTATHTSVPMPDTDMPRTIHTAELTGLNAKTVYQFRFGDNSKEFKFRTMPKDLSQPIRFIEGGDVYHQRDWMDQMNGLAGQLDPSFIVFGGDLAYANNRNNATESVTRWYDFFDSYKKKAVTPDGRLVPILVVLGNHEVKGFWGKTPESALGFYSLFAMPGKQGYNVLDFGNYLSLFLLDSGHTHPIPGAQTEWLKSELPKRKNVSHVFPIYHVPAYPSVRSAEEGENSDLTQEVREHWVPLFEKSAVKISFEHHDHAYKRTYPIRAGKVDPKGIIYLGDGAWGVKLRDTHPPEKTWYLEKGAATRHFYFVTLYADQRHIVAVNDHGAIFDDIFQRVK